MSALPPRWADRFLRWYCNPDLLEEVQGDAHELYRIRVGERGKRYADVRYVWDVMRFLRWSNIRRSEESYLPGSASVWNLNFKIAARNAGKNKMIFAVKVLGLSLSVAFALLITLFVVNEFTFDQVHSRSKSIFRVTSYIKFKGRVTHYAVTPLPLGQELVDQVPDVARYTRFMYEDKPVFSIRDNMFYDAVTLSADSNFLKIFSYRLLEGDIDALSVPDKIVLTKTLAGKFFGQEPALGQRIGFGKNFSLEVSAVIEDTPSNSHLAFDALISWSTFDRNDDWENLNAYTYIELVPGASIRTIKASVDAAVENFHDLVVQDYDATFEPRFENIKDIHFSAPLDEDIAIKGSKSNLYILISVVILFFGTGFINYLNLSLSEVQGNLRRIGVLRVFGGLAAGHGKMLVSDILFTLLIVVPLCIAMIWLGWTLILSMLSIHIDGRLFMDPVFIGAVVAFILLLIASVFFNSFALSKTRHVVQAMKGTLLTHGNSRGLRKVLVGLQLSFSIIITGLIIIMVDQFTYIQQADKGFDDRNTIVVKLRHRDPAREDAFVETLRKFAGVTSAEGSSYYPGMVEMKYVFQVETADGMRQQLVPLVTCSYDYLKTLGVTITKGRGFREDASDRYDGFIVNETAVKLFGWEDPIGKKILGPVTGQNDFYREGEVIGVARDFNFASLHSKIEPLIIFPADEFWVDRFVYVKLNALSPDVLPQIETTFKNQWADLPFEWEYLDARYRQLYAKDYQVRNLLGSGLVISILISCLGIFSMSALLSALRTKEMGIRKVVGASAGQLFLLHMKSFGLFLVIAMLIAWPMIGFLSSQWLQNFAYHVNPTIWYFILPSLLAVSITICASAYHGVRSALVNPMESLKYE